MDGVTELIALGGNKLLHAYVVAPEAVNCAVPPAQIVATSDVTVTDGKAVTITEILAVFEQLLASVPVTLYRIVDVGVTVLLATLPPPVSHEYDVPPDAEIVAAAPLHIIVGLAEAVIVGIVFTFKLTVAVF